MNRFSKKEALTYGWETFKTRVWFFASLGAVIMGLGFITDVLNEFLINPKTEQIFNAGAFGAQELWLILAIMIIFFAESFVQWWLYIGLIKITLDVYDKKEVTFHQLFSADLAMVWRYVIGSFLYGLIILGGFILLIVPGIIWSLKFQYYAYGIIDKNMGIIESLKYSAKITKDNKLNIFWFNLLSGLIMIAGFIALYVGIIFAMPIVFLAMVWVYRWLEYNSQPLTNPEPKEVVPVAK